MKVKKFGIISEVENELNFSYFHFDTEGVAPPISSSDMIKAISDYILNLKMKHISYDANGVGIIGCHFNSSPNEWDGEGLPPVGCICEVKVCDGYEQCEIVFSHPKSGVAYIYLDENEHGGNRPVDCISPIPAPLYFRPIRSEADKKRDEIIEALKDGLGHSHGLYDLMQIYHLLNNGKIPHIRID